MATCTEHGEWPKKFLACPKCFKDGDPSRPASRNSASDLKALSAIATAGPIRLNQHDRLSVLTSQSHPMCTFSNAYHRQNAHGEGADPEFMVALWNAYRAGELVHRDAVSERGARPQQIIDPPGAAVEMFRRKHGRLPNRPGDHLSLTDRLELAAQACRAAHLLSCEATCREAAALLSERSSDAETR